MLQQQGNLPRYLPSLITTAHIDIDTTTGGNKIFTDTFSSNIRIYLKERFQPGKPCYILIHDPYECSFEFFPQVLPYMMSQTTPLYSVLGEMISKLVAEPHVVAMGSLISTGTPIRKLPLRMLPTSYDANGALVITDDREGAHAKLEIYGIQDISPKDIF